MSTLLASTQCRFARSPCRGLTSEGFALLLHDVSESESDNATEA